MLRNTSVLPPRKVNPGIATAACASIRARLSALSGSASTPAAARIDSTMSCSKAVPASLTSAAATSGRSPRSNAPAIERPAWRRMRIRATASASTRLSAAPAVTANARTRQNTLRYRSAPLRS